MKIGFYFNDKGFSNIDLRNPLKGNNGIGGTQYCFIMLADALVKYSRNDVYFYHYNENIFPSGVCERVINSTNDMLNKCIEDKIDVLVFKTEGITEFVKSLRSTKISCVAWAHNYLWDEELKELTGNPQIKRIVFVGKEQYDRYIDHDAMKKATYIFNMFDGRLFAKRPLPQNPAVTYTGSLVKAKGFHILAQIWPTILKQVPDAQLYVIGSGRLYDRTIKLGDLGIAAAEYEEVFKDALTKDGKLLPSVHFCGTMGQDKLDVYAKTTVGVINPSGKTETFGLSAIEMEACGVPVVTKAANGLFDTVKNGYTGYLVHNQRQLARKVVELLEDKDKNDELGSNGKTFADSAFLPENIVEQWITLFEEIKNNVSPQYKKPTGNWGNNFKWIRFAIRKIRERGLPVKSFLEIECTVKKIIGK